MVSESSIENASVGPPPQVIAIIVPMRNCGVWTQQRDAAEKADTFLYRNLSNMMTKLIKLQEFKSQLLLRSILPEKLCYVKNFLGLPSIKSMSANLFPDKQVSEKI